MIGCDIGGCKLTELIGEGGFGSVYKAIQKELGRMVAVKLLQPGRSDCTSEVRWFIEEAQIAGKLDHPNIIRIHSYGCDSGTYFVVMEYLEGKTLDSALVETHRMEINTAISIAKQIAAALDYAHRRGVIHGDLNPRNVMLALNGRVVIGDFLGDKSGAQAGRTVVGVPEYVSPEQARGLSATPKSDIYSLGVIMYEMLTGRPPFSEDTASDTLFRHISSEPKRPDGLNPSIPAELSELIMRMLAKNPDSRPENCAEILVEIDKIEADNPTGKASGKRFERKPPSPVLVTALIFVLSALGGVGWLINQSVAQEREFEALATASPTISATAALKRSAAVRYNDEMRHGRDMLDHHRFRDAATSFHRACKLQPDKIDPHLYLASIFIQRDDYRMAESELNVVLKMDQTNKDALKLLHYIRSKRR